MRKKKNNFIRKALVFASVFIILLMSCSTVIFAQAPNFDGMSNYPSSNRQFRQVYFYIDNNLVCIYSSTLTVGTNNILNANFIFTDYYFNNYYTGDVDNDFLSFSQLYGNSYVLSSSGMQTNNSATVADSTLYYVLSTRGETSATYSQRFKSSYNDQLAYWDYYKTYYENAYSLGYTKALNDTQAFENGIYTLFNAPFVFVRNIVGFEIFGITLVDILCGVLLLCLGFVLLKFIGGAIPL